MAIQKEIWATDIAANLFPDNSFISKARKDDAWVSNSKVHLPQSGAAPGVERNRSSLPATAGQRTDTLNSYDLDEFTSTPTLIRDIEEVETSYDKRSSVVRDHSREINRMVANWMQTYWAPAQSANFIRTSGTDTHSAFIAGATGTRKALTIEDVFKLMDLFDDMEIPAENRCLLVPSKMYNELIANNWKDLLDADKSGKARVQDGQLLNLLGFQIFKRSSANSLSYTNAATPVLRTPDSSTLTTANAAALAWHPEFVRRALGSVKVYADYDKPDYYGSIFSALVRAGGETAYSDETGIAAIIEAQ